MYEYYAKDINLPDFDPVPPTWQQQMRSNADGLMSWIKDNQGMLSQGYEIIRQIIINKGQLPALAEDVEESVESEALPSIN